MLAATAATAETAALDVVVELTADTDEVVQRLLRRAEIEGRPDDTEDVIRHRQEVYAGADRAADRRLSPSAGCSYGSTAWVRSTRSTARLPRRCRASGLSGRRHGAPRGR